MSQRDFAGARPGAAAHQPSITDGVMRRAKRPFPNQRRIRRQQTGHAVNFGHFQSFVDGHAWQNAGQRPGDERLTGSRRARHDDVVSAGSGNFHGPFDVLLAHNVGKIGGIGHIAGERFF